MAQTVWDIGELPVGEAGHNAVGWWGMLCLIATEASLFAYLLFSYYYFAAQHGRAWFPEDHPKLNLSGPDTAILIASSVALWWGEQGLKKSDHRRHLIGLGGAILLGVAFLVIQAFEWKTKTFGLASGPYGSLFFTITGFHMAHVIAGVLILSTVFLWATLGRYTPRRHATVMISSVYWHFVDVVWLAVFFTFYVSPYLW